MATISDGLLIRKIANFVSESPSDARDGALGDGLGTVRVGGGFLHGPEAGAAIIVAVELGGVELLGAGAHHAFVAKMNENYFHISKTLSALAQIRLESLDGPVKSGILAVPCKEQLKVNQDGLERARLSEEEKQALRKKWGL